MPIPIIPIAAALGAGAIGYYIGRTTAALSNEESSTNVIFCGDFGNTNKDETGDAEAPMATAAPETEDNDATGDK